MSPEAVLSLRSRKCVLWWSSTRLRQLLHLRQIQWSRTGQPLEEGPPTCGVGSVSAGGIWRWLAVAVRWRACVRVFSGVGAILLIYPLHVAFKCWRLAYGVDHTPLRGCSTFGGRVAPADWLTLAGELRGDGLSCVRPEPPLGGPNRVLRSAWRCVCVRVCVCVLWCWRNLVDLPVHVAYWRRRGVRGV